MADVQAASSNGPAQSGSDIICRTIDSAVPSSKSPERSDQRQSSPPGPSALIDVHQHLAFDASADPVARLEEDDDATLVLRMRLAAQRALAVGITTIRDLGDRNHLSVQLRDWLRCRSQPPAKNCGHARRSNGIDLQQAHAHDGSILGHVRPYPVRQTRSCFIRIDHRIDEQPTSNDPPDRRP